MIAAEATEYGPEARSSGEDCPDWRRAMPGQERKTVRLKADTTYGDRMRYRVSVDRGEITRERRSVGLCFDCEHGREVESSHHTTFHLCQRSTTDSSFPRYPRLPVIECRGYDRRESQ